MLAAKSPRPFPSHQSLACRYLARLFRLSVKTVRRVFLAVGISSLWVAGCATQADLQQVRSERSTIQSSLSNTSASIDTLRRELERVQDQVATIHLRLERASQTGSETTSRLARLDKGLTSLETRLRAVERGRPGLADETVAPEPAPEADTPSLPFGGLSPPTEPAVITDTPVCDDIYRGALRLFQARDFSAAIQGFRTFLRRCHDSAMADDAQFWIGESHYVQNDYNLAILEFNDVLSYRRGDRRAAALLRQAQCFLALGDKTDARLILQKLVSDYPAAAETAEAQDMLQALVR